MDYYLNNQESLCIYFRVCDLLIVVVLRPVIPSSL